MTMTMNAYHKIGGRRAAGSLGQHLVHCAIVLSNLILRDPCLSRNLCKRSEMDQTHTHTHTQRERERVSHTQTHCSKPNHAAFTYP